jgi:broad specificity phosphatase PhoE
MNIIDYKDKYIKYKIKYLDLIKQYAGTYDTKVVLLCSHQGRLACLIHALTGNKLEQNFKNCCIIKLSKIEDVFSLEIVYEGEFVFECNDNKTACEKKATEEGKYYKNNENLLNPKAKDIIQDLFPNNNVVIYMVRHGDGEHLALKRKGVFAKIGQNISDRVKSSDKKILRDARLTNEGKKQAQNAGEELNCLLDNNSIDFIFFSDLERTRQTIAEMLSKIESNKISDNVRTIVLPCSHEVGYKKDGSNCDGIGFIEYIKRRFITENIPRLDKIKDFPQNMPIQQPRIISIDTSRYSEFYNPKITDDSKKVLRHKSSSVNKCKNLTMLQEIASVVEPKVK